MIPHTGRLIPPSHTRGLELSDPPTPKKSEVLKFSDPPPIQYTPAPIVNDISLMEVVLEEADG